MLPRFRSNGFTLSELLIALAILGLIATFTIPKVLQSQSDGKQKSIAKEAIATLSDAYSAYKLSKSPTGSVSPADLTPYMNYVKVDSTSTIDVGYNSTGSWACSGTPRCLVLHNGAILRVESVNTFGGTNSTNYIYANLDPDGVLTSSATATGPGKSLTVALYYNGRITLIEQCQAGDSTAMGGAPQNWCPGDPANIPPWFNWN